MNMVPRQHGRRCCAALGAKAARKLNVQEAWEGGILVSERASFSLLPTPVFRPLSLICPGSRGKPHQQHIATSEPLHTTHRPWYNRTVEEKRQETSAVKILPNLVM